ncbi:MAG: ABC transporter substrate-binding protein [Armatimonadota bacterium]|nr:ABC transporter substrate-binding protein [Armatimonadota bacterium]MDR7562375.1 ABC transporter substrate-binding protein [Armatimonadota bacterium]MDR7567246.1 ABC transporter substrate-binding protein [Armatimonadota bacterium]MDR7601543.1 ABC transporter substrate-binding protein [Armatimonadota bacterium]
MIRFRAGLALWVFLLAALMGLPAAFGGPAEPIVLGVPTALGHSDGADSLRAVQLAAEEINVRGGVRVGGARRPLQVVSIDTREHEPGIPIHDALAALEKLITERRPHAIVVGAFRSEVLLASMDVIARYRVPYIVTIAMTPLFEQRVASDPGKYRYLFRMGLQSEYFAGNLARVLGFVKSRYGLSRVHFAYQDVLWAKGTVSILETWARQSGWTVVGSDAYPTGATDFSATVIRAQSGRAQILVPVFDMPQAGILVKQVRTARLPVLMAGYVVPVVPGTAWQTFEGAVDGFVQFLHEPGAIAVKALSKSVHFNRAYGRKYGEEARLRLGGHGPGPSYDAVYVVAAAIERAGTLEADRVADEIRRTDMEGVIGRIRFNERHQVVYGGLPHETAISLAFQWRAPGRRVVVWPEIAAEDEIRLPAELRR